MTDAIRHGSDRRRFAPSLSRILNWDMAHDPLGKTLWSPRPTPRPIVLILYLHARCGDLEGWSHNLVGPALARALNIC